MIDCPIIGQVCVVIGSYLFNNISSECDLHENTFDEVSYLRILKDDQPQKNVQNMM